MVVVVVGKIEQTFSIMNFNMTTMDYQIINIGSTHDMSMNLQLNKICLYTVLSFI